MVAASSLASYVVVMFCLLSTCSDLCAYAAGFLLSYFILILSAFRLQQPPLAAGWLLDSSLSAASTWPALKTAALWANPKHIVPFDPFNSHFEDAVGAEVFDFRSHEMTISHRSLARVLRRTVLHSPLVCRTAVISHLFSVSHKSCVGHAERSSSVPPYHWKRGVFPRVILIYSSIQPAHCCLNQLWSSSIQLDPRFSPSLSYITPPILHAPHLFPEVRFGIGWECVQWY